MVRSNEEFCICNVFVTPYSKNPVKSSIPSCLNDNFSYQRDNLRNSDLRSNPCFTRICGVVRCGEKRWDLLSSQRICNTFATKISKKYRTLFGGRHWRVSFFVMQILHRQLRCPHFLRFC